MSTRVNIDNAAIQRMLQDPSGPTGEALRRFAVQVETTAKRLCPVDRGLLRSSITHNPIPDRDARGLVIRVGSHLNYAIYVEFGTGLWNERPGAARLPIVPKHAKALAFKVKGKTVFARSVKGQMAQPYLRPALAEIALRRGTVAVTA